MVLLQCGSFLIAAFQKGLHLNRSMLLSFPFHVPHGCMFFETLLETIFPDARFAHVPMAVSKCLYWNVIMTP